MSEAAVEAVIKLGRDAAQAVDVSFNAPDVLPFAAAAIEIIRAHPTLRPEFEAAFLSMLGDAAREFIEVCMHALRWQSLKEKFEHIYRAAIDRNDWRAEPTYRHILDAFEDDWENAGDFYSSYFRAQ